jgi:hypothetical protein
MDVYGSIAVRLKDEYTFHAAVMLFVTVHKKISLTDVKVFQRSVTTHHFRAQYSVTLVLG